MTKYEFIIIDYFDDSANWLYFYSAMDVRLYVALAEDLTDLYCPQKKIYDMNACKIINIIFLIKAIKNLMSHNAQFSFKNH